MQVMQHHVRSEVTDHRAAFMGRLPDDKQIRLSVVLPLRNQAALTSLLQRLYDPSSPDYRQFLTVAQFTEQFGPTTQDYAAVSMYLQSQGLTVNTAPANRLIVPVSGSVAQINSAFNVQMSTYQHPSENRTFFSPDMTDVTLSFTNAGQRPTSPSTMCCWMARRVVRRVPTVTASRFWISCRLSEWRRG